MALAATGCAVRIAIMPSELPKLTGGATEIQGTTTSYGDVRPLVRVRTVNGNLIEVKRNTPVYVTTTSGDEEIEFLPPVEATISNGVLELESSNHRRTRFTPDQIRKVEVNYRP